MFIRRSLGLSGIIGIASALIAAHRLINIYCGGIVLKDRPQKVFIIGTHLIFGSEESL